MRSAQTRWGIGLLAGLTLIWACSSKPDSTSQPDAGPRESLASTAARDTDVPPPAIEPEPNVAPDPAPPSE
ncbi:MAG: hypothetical protein ABI614_24055, partial [Planctomycetota bacterium]